MVRVGRDHCGSPSPTPCPSRVTQSRLHSTVSRRVLNVSREGDSTAPLGSLGQGSITFRVKKFFLVFRRNATSTCWKPPRAHTARFPLVVQYVSKLYKHMYGLDMQLRSGTGAESSSSPWLVLPPRSCLFLHNAAHGLSSNPAPLQRLESLEQASPYHALRLLLMGSFHAGQAGPATFSTVQLKLCTSL